ncbi:stage III sporulation protein AG [Paenibacillus soyae]|uniref:Stage III sporulation protein AG n=1 Tax=Paenibacillus soyae TaxID=2969249 RepID=A0A9X2MMJ6_9BACL|nr:stage III sporulation protein AG [Paenibacillus soyae]MCR2803115.1 stage III sporulation protein AG [Paenibacillus soyae]
MAKWLDGLESAVGGGPSGPKRIRTLRILLIVGGIGAALMLINSFLPYRDVESPAQDPNPPPSAEEAWSQNASAGSPFETIEGKLESRLKDILEKIVGVDGVNVLVTVESTEEIVVAQEKNESQSITDENDRNGGVRHITSINKEGKVVLYEVSGDQKPIITKTLNPRIRGVIIVAKGAENATVRQLIIHAVERGLSVSTNRISVIPSKQ